jgi:Phytanoyl-CoA dioxygenase (PhyH)
MSGGYRVLNEEQAQQFLQRGFVVIHGCFGPDVAEQAVQEMWARLGYDPDDAATWVEKRIHMPTLNRFEVKTFAPEAWYAVCDLVGGAERVREPYRWGDAFIVNLGVRADQPWAPPSAASPGWHTDGDFFRHFLDSPEQGLLTLVLWTDVVHQGGATFVATDSVGPVARFLLDHPQGVLPNGFDVPALIPQCHQFIEATGKAGDVYLLHPFVLHATAQNILQRPRVITNPPVSLKEPMRFDRDRWEDHSLVEQAVLRNLGMERCPFTPSAARERVVPERVRRQATYARPPGVAHGGGT